MSEQEAGAAAAAEAEARPSMYIGESFVGSGPNSAHVNVVVGDREGPVGTAWATALATPSAGHAPFVAVLQPGLPVKPFTLFVGKARIEGAAHGRMTWGPAQAGVAAGVADAVAAGVVAEQDAEQLLLIAAVWVDPAADDADAVFANNREATRSAIVIGVAGLPAARDAVAKRAEAWNPYYKPSSPEA
jgi:5,6,7,8-tetrahydromethanopterin hydro-lyase